jgi:hypothetical protein
MDVMAYNTASRPAAPPPSRTDWTRLVPPSVLTGHVSSRVQARRPPSLPSPELDALMDQRARRPDLHAAAVRRRADRPARARPGRPEGGEAMGMRALYKLIEAQKW